MHPLINTFHDEHENHISVCLSKTSDGFLLDLNAREMAGFYKIQWKTQLAGLDQRYWDFELEGILLTLHLEHYLGIYIFAYKSKHREDKIRALLNQIEKHFEAWKSAD